MGKLDLFKTILQLVPLVITSIKAVERLIVRSPEQSQDEFNRERQDAAVDLVGDLVPLIEGYIAKDVIDDELVQAALRKVIDTIISLSNVVRDVQTKREAHQ